MTFSSFSSSPFHAYSLFTSSFFLSFSQPLAATLAFIVLQPTIDKIADGLIAGNEAGLTDFLKLIVDQTTDIAGTLLPSPLREVLGITGPILNIVKNCPAS